MRTIIFGFVAAVVLGANGEPVAVRQAQGAAQGFLLVRSESGAVIGNGTLMQVSRGRIVTSRLTYRFKDGSLDDDTVVFSQNGSFRLLSDHHIQRGPFFPTPIDVMVDTKTGQVTSRTVEKTGKIKVETKSFDFPLDLANGLIGTLLLNVDPKGSEFKLGFLAPSGKGRLIKLAVAPTVVGHFSVVGVQKTANVFRVKVELGGVAGVAAPLVGKQPADTLVRVIGGQSPALIREIGQMYEGGPIVDIQLAGTSFPAAQ